MALTHHEARTLAAAVIECACRDIRGRKAGDGSEALRWLQSPRAHVYFDILELDQIAFIEALDVGNNNDA